MGRLARLLLQRFRTGHVHLLASRRRSRGEPSPSFRRTSRTGGTVINQGIQMIDLNWDLGNPSRSTYDKAENYASADAQPSGVPAWKTIPSFYLVGTIDNVIQPFAQLFMAQHANATIVQVRGSHLVMISHPTAVVGLIDQATLSKQDSLDTSSQQTLTPAIA